MLEMFRNTPVRILTPPYILDIVLEVYLVINVIFGPRVPERVDTLLKSSRNPLPASLLLLIMVPPVVIGPPGSIYGPLQFVQSNTTPKILLLL